MKNILILFFCLLARTAPAQDIFKTKLYSTSNLIEVREDIGLTEAQVAKIKKLHTENAGQFSSLKWDLDDATSKIRKMLDQKKIDQVAVSRQMDEVLRLENQLKKIQLNTMIAIKNELSPEQISKLEEPKMFYVSKGNTVSGDKITSINGTSSKMIVDGAVISTSPKLSVSVIGNGEQPLYYIETKSGMKKVLSFEQIDPKDIESVSVLKGEQALEKYGSAGKNGVVVIKLKNMPE
ncbi:MAG: hypothetical protein ACI9UV_002663 [Algoriphagus sp.]|jgi:hypothetical protein